MIGTRCGHCGFDLGKAVKNRRLKSGRDRVKILRGFWVYGGEYSEAPRGKPVDRDKKGWLIRVDGTRADILFKRQVEVQDCRHFNWEVIEGIPLSMFKVEK